MKSSSPGIFSDPEVTDFLSFSQAVRTSMYGRPGACYVDIAGDMVNAKVDRSQVRLIMTCFRLDIFFFPLRSCIGLIQLVSVELCPAVRIHR